MAVPGFELDPLFKRAIRLLHSHDKESTLELKKMLDDALKDRQQGTMKAKRRSPSPVEWQKAAGAFMNDFVCVKCRSFDVGPSNRLVECSSCQKLHHQECHSPKIPDWVAAENSSKWRCSSCGPSGNRPTPSSATRPVTSSSNSTNPSKPKFPPPPSYKRPFLSSSSSLDLQKKAGSSGQPPAAKVVKPSSSALPPAATATVSAEKRMQLMKKKAAAKKIQEHKNKLAQ